MASSRTSLAVRGISAPTKRDRTVWYEHRRRLSHEEIAQRHNMKVEAVKSAIDRFEIYRSLTSNEEIDMRLNAVVLNQINRGEKALQEALTAKVVVRKTDSEGRTVVDYSEPDHKTRLEAFKEIRGMADRNIPKGGNVQVNVQQNAGEGASVERGRGFEEMVRAARERKGLTNGENIEEAEYEDIDESADEDDEEELEEENDTA